MDKKFYIVIMAALMILGATAVYADDDGAPQRGYGSYNESADGSEELRPMVGHGRGMRFRGPRGPHSDIEPPHGKFRDVREGYGPREHRGRMSPGHGVKESKEFRGPGPRGSGANGTGARGPGARGDGASGDGASGTGVRGADGYGAPPVPHPGVTPYGDFCDKCSKYGMGRSAVTQDRAIDALEFYFESKGLIVNNVRGNGRFLQVDIMNRTTIVDKVLFDRRTGRIRSIY
jgi:hypothetical protein